MSMQKSLIAASVAALVLASGCSAPANTAPTSEAPVTTTASPEVSQSVTPTASPTPEQTAPPATYSSVVELKNQLAAGGYDCSQWQQHDRVKLALQSGSCSDADVLSVYLTPAEVQESVQLLKGFGEHHLVVGENWIVNSPKTLTVQEILGGTIVEAADKVVQPSREDRLFIIGAKGETETSRSDDEILILGHVACEAMRNGELADGAAAVKDHLGVSDEKSRSTAIMAVMYLCPELENLLPTE